MKFAHYNHQLCRQKFRNCVDWDGCKNWGSKSAGRCGWERKWLWGHRRKFRTDTAIWHQQPVYNSKKLSTSGDQSSRCSSRESSVSEDHSGSSTHKCQEDQDETLATYKHKGIFLKSFFANAQILLLPEKEVEVKQQIAERLESIGRDHKETMMVVTDNLKPWVIYYTMNSASVPDLCITASIINAKVQVLAYLPTTTSIQFCMPLHHHPLCQVHQPQHIIIILHPCVLQQLVLKSNLQITSPLGRLPNMEAQACHIDTGILSSLSHGVILWSIGMHLSKFRGGEGKWMTHCRSWFTTMDYPSSRLALTYLPPNSLPFCCDRQSAHRQMGSRVSWN